MFSESELFEILENKYLQYNCPAFIENDPVSVPHLFSQKENIEIAGFLAASIAWGNRKSIVKNAQRLVALLENDPFDFIINAGQKDFLRFNTFCHRTFNSVDTRFFLNSLGDLYKFHGGLEKVFTHGYTTTGTIAGAIDFFRTLFLQTQHEPRSEKHIANIQKGSSAKRINMFLRWMVRNDPKGVDFGIWPKIDTSALLIPLDVHTGNVARSFNLLQRKQNDFKAVEELTNRLRMFDSADPVKYDYALFGMGVYEHKL